MRLNIRRDCPKCKNHNEQKVEYQTGHWNPNRPNYLVAEWVAHEHFVFTCIICEYKWEVECE